MDRNNYQFRPFYKTLNQYQKRVDSEMGRFFDQKIKESKLVFKEATETIKVLRDVNLGGGKRIRPILVNIGYFLAGGKDKKEILKACLSVEFIHNWFLIHDDIIDQDELRRGRSTLHTFYGKNVRDKHMGISLAIVAGDISAAFGYQVLINTKFPEKFKTKALEVFHQAVVNTCHGEMLELFIRDKKDKLNEKNILNVCKNKTAYYTFVNPLKIGAALAGASDRFLRQIDKFALPIGIAFQIQDDILGLFASQKKLGKPIASDIEENQPNLLIVKTFNLAKGKDKQEFKKYLGKKKLTQEQIKRIREIVKQSGAFDYCQKKARTLVKKAKPLIKELKASPEEKGFLLSMADYIINRDY